MGHRLYAYPPCPSQGHLRGPVMPLTPTRGQALLTYPPCPSQGHLRGPTYAHTRTMIMITIFTYALIDMHPLTPIRTKYNISPHIRID